MSDSDYYEEDYADEQPDEQPEEAQPEPEPPTGIEKADKPKPKRKTS